MVRMDKLQIISDIRRLVKTHHDVRLYEIENICEFLDELENKILDENKLMGKLKDNPTNTSKHFSWRNEVEEFFEEE